MSQDETKESSALNRILSVHTSPSNRSSSSSSLNRILNTKPSENMRIINENARPVMDSNDIVNAQNSRIVKFSESNKKGTNQDETN